MAKPQQTGKVSVLRPLQDFLRTETSGGALLVIAAAIAIIIANSPLSDEFTRFWETRAAVGLGDHVLDLSLRGWLNDAAMAIFFFVAGLEIKRELVEGELRSVRKALLPIGAAIGGMIVPALIYTAFNRGADGAPNGWGIPMATDIALAVGVVALLGKRIPASLRMFLLTLAIVDDLGAILVIAFAYTKGLTPAWLLLALAAVVAVVVLTRLGVHAIGCYIALGVVMWFALHEAHVHPTIAGVAMGLLTPARPRFAHDAIDADEISDISSIEAVQTTLRGARGSVSELEWLSHRLHPWTSYLIVPLFALANAGVKLSGDAVSDALSSRITLGIFLGLVIGKPVGIVGACWLMRTFKLADLPQGVTMRDITTMGFLGGIGFTVATFIAEQALDQEIIPQAKVGILAASILAAVLGSVLAMTRRKPAAAAATTNL